MSFRTAYLMALKNIGLHNKRRDHRLVGAVLAVGFSLIPLVVVLEVAGGMIEGITRRFIEIGTYHLQVHIYDRLTTEELERVCIGIEKREDVHLAFVERQGLGLIFSSGGRTGAQIRSVPSWIYQRDALLRRYFTIESGAFDLERPDSVLLGKVVAERLGVSVGDEVKLLTAKRMKEGRYIPRVSRLRVRGIFTTGYQDMDKLWIYIPLQTGRLILPWESSREFIGVKVVDPYKDLKRYTEQIRDSLPEDLVLYRINTWFELEENQYRSFQTTKALLIFIMCLIVLVASVNVSSTMVMMVMEKTQEIGILKGIGARPGLISLSFIITGFLTGVAGSAFGITLGLVLAVNINEVIRAAEHFLNGIRALGLLLVSPFYRVQAGYPITLLDPAFYLERIPIRISLHEIVAVAAFAIFLSTLASYIPAKRAGRVRPLEVLRRV
jgi:lipoprotein-releasing system permease protein